MAIFPGADKTTAEFKIQCEAIIFHKGVRVVTFATFSKRNVYIILKDPERRKICSKIRYLSNRVYSICSKGTNMHHRYANERIRTRALLIIFIRYLVLRFGWPLGVTTSLIVSRCSILRTNFSLTYQ